MARAPDDRSFSVGLPAPLSAAGPDTSYGQAFCRSRPKWLLLRHGKTPTSSERELVTIRQWLRRSPGAVPPVPAVVRWVVEAAVVVAVGSEAVVITAPTEAIAAEMAAGRPAGAAVDS